MERLQHIFEGVHAVALRSGLSLKENYKVEDAVWGIIDINKLEPQDRDAVSLSLFIEDYVSQLLNANVPTIDVLEIKREDDFVIIKTECMAEFLDHSVKSGKTDFWRAASEILKTIKLASDANVGIDPTPKNFAVSDRNHILYADFFIPSQQDM